MSLLDGKAPLSVWEWLGIMLLLAALRQMFLFMKLRTTETFIASTSERITERFLANIRTLSPRLFHNATGEEKIESAFESVQAMQANGSVFFQAIQAVLQLLTFFPVLFYISWPLTLFLFAAIVPLVAFIQRRLHAMGPQEQAILQKRSDFRIYLGLNRRLLRNWSGKRERILVSDTLGQKNSDLRQTELKANLRKNELSISMETISVLSMVAVLAFCSILIGHGWMDATGLVLYCSALLLCYKPVKECTRILPQFRSLASAYRVLEEFEKLPQKADVDSIAFGSRMTDSRMTGGDANGPSLDAGKGNEGLEIRHGTFHYEGTETPVYSNFNIELPFDKPILFRGKNGIGKSTLLRLIAGLEEWESGSSPVNTDEVFFIPQDLELPPRQLLWDLYEQKKEYLQEFVDVAKTAPLLKKQGLSGGERSRIALLWALASDCNTVLLDEPMAAIALADREKILLTFLDSARRQNKRVIMSSHDPFSAAVEDRFNIVEMEHAKG